jgi:WD40 repeat protein
MDHDPSLSKLTNFTVESWNPPMSYGGSHGEAALDQIDEKSRRSRHLSTQEMAALWSSSTFLGKSQIPFPGSDEPNRVAFADAFRNHRRNRCTVTVKSPPPMSVFVLDSDSKSNSVNAVTANCDASLFAAAIESRTVVWSTPNHTSKQGLDEHSASKSYQSLFLPHSLHRSDLPTGRGTVCLDFAPDAPVLLSGTARGDLGLWSVEASQKLVTFTGLTSRTAIWSLGWCPAGSYFTTGSSDGCARLWRSDIPFPIRVIRMDDENRHCQLVSWHPSCQLLGIAADQVVTVHDITSNSAVFRFDFKGATAIEFSPTGYLLAAANKECLCVWELSTGTAIFHYDTFTTIVGLSWTHPSGSLLGDGGLKSVTQQAGVGHPVLLSVEESGKVRMWDRLFVNKPSACEFELEQPIRPLHMHVTPRNLLVLAGTIEVNDSSLPDALQSVG